MWGWIKDAAQGAWDFIKGVGSALAQTIKWILQRGIGILDFFLTLAGIMPEKKIRVEARILVKDGKPVADRDDVQAVLDLANEVFKQGVNVRVVSRTDRPTLIPDDAPARNLVVACGAGAFASAFSSVGAWFRRHLARSPAGTVFGYGSPVTVFVVENVEGKKGCSVGFLADFVVIDPEALRGDEGSLLTLAHEVGHACDLVHAGAGTSLMRASSDGRTRRMKRLQRAIFRSSPHVTYF
jgi:hypothetical protein